MHDEDLSFDELAESQEQGTAHRGRSSKLGRRRGRRRGGFVSRALPLLLVVLVLGGVAVGGV